MFELPQFPKGFNSEVVDFLNSAKEDEVFPRRMQN